MSHDPCPKCRRDRWKTLIKGAAWMCRWCSYVRKVCDETTEAAS